MRERERERERERVALLHQESEKEVMEGKEGAKNFEFQGAENSKGLQYSVLNRRWECHKGLTMMVGHFGVQPRPGNSKILHFFLFLSENF